MSERTEAFKNELVDLLEKYDCEMHDGRYDGHEGVWFAFTSPFEDVDGHDVFRMRIDRNRKVK